MKLSNRRTLLIVLLSLVLLLATTAVALADKPTSFDGAGNEVGWTSGNNACVKIGSGLLFDTYGNQLTLGFDQFGYNYQAHIFNGTYDSVDRILDGKYWGATGDYVDDSLMMKWSDEWLANVDCNGDGKLDRGLVDGNASGTSLGWETNHVEGDYIDVNGDLQHYTYFVKIVWVGPGGSLWGQYEVIEEIYNDPAGGFNGVLFKDVSPGFGLNDQWTTQ